MTDPTQSLLDRVRSDLSHRYHPSHEDLLSLWQHFTGETLHSGERCTSCEGDTCPSCDMTGYSVLPSWFTPSR